LEQPLLQLDPVSRLLAPSDPSGPIAFAGESNAECLTACLVSSPVSRRVGYQPGLAGDRRWIYCIRSGLVNGH